MKYYFIAGEASGDLHASNLIKALKAQDNQAQFQGFGGNLMQAEGLKLTQHYESLAFMGFYEVFRNITVFTKALKTCKADIESFRPDVLILVDFAGFNLRIAKWAKRNGIKVYYYIAPKVWAWNTSRVKQLKAFVDELFCILPFEKAFFASHNVKVHYVGNPVNDAIKAFNPNANFRNQNNLDERPILAVLPGSRKQEIEQMLHFMLSIIPPFMKDFQFVVAGIGSLPEEYYEKFRRHDTIRIVYNQTYDLLSNAHAALVTSGTATLETAMFSVPQVVCYKTSEITYAIAKMLIKVKFISLVNLIMNREVVKELIQDQFRPANLLPELKAILEGGSKRAQILSDYQSLQELLGKENASENSAKIMVGLLKQ